jgi:two-component system, NarL family, nitrate/nitrite response regulator NarL
MPVHDVPCIRVLIVDDHTLVRAALRMLLESQPGVVVVGEAAGLDDALSVTSREQPDIVLLDLDLGACNGIDLLPQLHTAAPKTHVVVLTGVRDGDIHRRAVRLGAMGLVLKDHAAEVLLQAIAKVCAGEVWLDSVLVADVLSEMTRPPLRPATNPEALRIATLTAREREVIDLVGQGLKNQVMADRLCISEATVRHHLTSIFAKLGVDDRLQLAIYAYRHGLAYVFPPHSPPRAF